MWLNTNLALMWLIHHVAHGYLMWSVLVTSAVSLPTNFRSSDAWSDDRVRSSPLKVQLNLKHLPRGATRKVEPWGSLLQSDQSQIPPEQAPGLPALSLAAISQSTSSHVKQSLAKFGKEEILPLAFLGVMAIGLLLAFMQTDEAISNLEQETPAAGAQGIAEIIPEKVEVMEIPKTSSRGTANTKANLAGIEAMQSGGTWANTYRRTDTLCKDALELLFRCNIIPNEEFAHSYVSQEHIDECVWISTQMLRQKPLEEWVDDWPSARKTFEESVTACFAARTDVITNLYGTSPPNSPGAQEIASDKTNSPTSKSRSYSPSSDRGGMDCGTPILPVAGRPAGTVDHISPPPTVTMLPAPVPPPMGALEHLGSSPPTVTSLPNTTSLTEDQHASPDRQRKPPYFRERGASAEQPGSAAAGAPSPEKEFQELVGQASGRSSVVARCREIMQGMPPRESPVRPSSQQRLAAGSPPGLPGSSSADPFPKQAPLQRVASPPLDEEKFKIQGLYSPPQAESLDAVLDAARRIDTDPDLHMLPTGDIEGQPIGNPSRMQAARRVADT